MPQLFCEASLMVFQIPAADPNIPSEFCLGRGSHQNGRSKRSNALILNHTRISKSHAVLLHSLVRGWGISDTSTNGTLLNNVGFSQQTVFGLQDHDVISILPLELVFFAVDQPIPQGWRHVTQFPFALELKYLAEKCQTAFPVFPALCRLEMLR
jgi:hypothetical protein